MTKFVVTTPIKVQVGEDRYGRAEFKTLQPGEEVDIDKAAAGPLRLVKPAEWKARQGDPAAAKDLAAENESLRSQVAAFEAAAVEKDKQIADLTAKVDAKANGAGGGKAAGAGKLDV